MKKFKLLITLLMIVMLSACSDDDNSRPNTIDTSDQTREISNNSSISSEKVLVAYFSIPETDGVDTSSSASRVATDNGVLGNTQYVASIIQEEMNGDLFRIETVQNYPGTHDPLLEFAYEERSEDARPELSLEVENFDQYDVIFIGYPNWNADLPMPLYTFLEQYDFSGKIIIPFSTHGGSGFSGTIGTIADLQPNATVVSNGYTVSRNSVSSSDEEIREWIETLNLND